MLKSLPETLRAEQGGRPYQVTSQWGARASLFRDPEPEYGATGRAISVAGREELSANAHNGPQRKPLAVFFTFKEASGRARERWRGWIREWLTHEWEGQWAQRRELQLSLQCNSIWTKVVRCWSDDYPARVRLHCRAVLRDICGSYCVYTEDLLRLCKKAGWNWASGSTGWAAAFLGWL